VVLKSLNNSQNITLEFLKEISNTKLVDEPYVKIVKCYGISQNPVTKEHIMIMSFMSRGNLREYLQK